MFNHLFDRFRIFRHQGEYRQLHDLTRFYVYLLLVWGFYRLLFRFPVWVEEFWLKPLVFLLPVILRLKKEAGDWRKRLASVGITWKNLFAAVAFGLSLGVFYLFVGRLGQFFRFGSIGVDPYGAALPVPLLTVGLALATAISEEVTFMGYLLPRLQRVLKDEWRSATLTGLLFATIHLPILIFGYRLPLSWVVGQFLLTFILGFGNSVLMLRLKNVAAPILSHALWGMAVLLFR